MLLLSAQAIMEFEFAPAERYIRKIEPEMDTLIYAKAQFNRGLIYFIKKDYDTATEAFNTTLKFTDNRDPVSEKAIWFLANIAVREGNFEQARSYAEQTIQLDGLYKDDAWLMLGYLEEQKSAAE